MIRESNHVSITDSHLSTAGGNVNNIEVNVTLSSQPPSTLAAPPSPWSRILGAWLLGLAQATPVPLFGPPPPQVPEAFAPVDEPLAASSHPPRLTDGSVDVVPLDHAHMYQRLALPSVPTWHPHEIYVRQLYPAGHGYPCANPMPWGRPIQIGDIGKLESDGFKVLQNLYSLPDNFLKGDLVPVVPVVHNTETFVEGDTVTGGVSQCEVKTANSNSMHIDEIVIHCPREEGAALAITSPAELRQMESNDALHDFLCQHASRLFEFLLERHSLPEGTSLYVVTGTILSASWATATYAHPMDPSYNSLVLKRVSGNESQAPYYMWTKKGNAQTRTQGRQVRATKDQCLFLRGFLLDASPGFWKERKEAVKLQHTRQESSDQKANERQSGGDSNTIQRSDSSMAHRGPGTANSLSLGPSPPVLSGPVSKGLSGITIHSIPSRGTLAKDYPSYRVNRSLLDLTTADFAITHDDDWREAVVNAGAANDPAVNRIYSEDLAKQVRRIMPGNVTIKNGVAFLVGDAARHIPVVTSTEQTAQRDTPRQPTTLGDREQELQTNPPAQQSSSDPSIYAPQQGLYSHDFFVSGAATSRTPAAPSFDPLSADDNADFEDPVFNSGTKPHPSAAGPSTQRTTGAGQEERAKWAFVLDTDGGQGSSKMSDSIAGVQNVIPPFVSAERGKDKNRERTNMAPEAEEWWLSGIRNGVYKVVQKSQGAQQRLHIVPHRNGVRYPNHDTSDGPSITIHKHSKAFAFSISRRYSPKTALNAQGQSSLSARPSRMPVRSPSRMVLLASGKVQEAYHSTTAQLNNYGLPSHGGRLARMQKEDAHGRDEQRMTPEKEKGKGKYRSTPSSRSNLMVDESSLDNGSGRVSADHRHGPGIASTSQLPQSRTKQPVVDDTVRSQGTVPFDGAIAYQEQGSEFLLNNEDNGWKAPTRIPPADTHIIWPKDLKIPLPENHTVPWLTSQPRLREEEFGTSTPNARLLAVEDRASQKRRKRRQRSLSEPRNVFANIPAGMPYMLLPLWPGETDLGSDIQTPFTIPHIPDEKRLYLLIQYPPSEPPPPPQDERGHDANEISSQGFPTLSRDLVRADKTTLFQRFHIFAKVVTHGDIQRSGVRIPDAGLSVFGSLQEAYESMPQERHVHTGFAIIGFYDSRGGGVEFFPEGLEKLGVVNCELDRNASVRPEDDTSSKDQEEPDSTPVLTPIGFAVVEMAWLGAMALTRFR